MKQTIISYQECKDNLDGYAIEGLKFLQANVSDADIDAYEFSVGFINKEGQPVTFIEGSMKDGRRRVLLYETRMMEIDDQGIIYVLETENRTGDIRKFCDTMKDMEAQNPGTRYEWIPFQSSLHYKQDQPLR